MFTVPLVVKTEMTKGLRHGNQRQAHRVIARFKRARARQSYR